MKRSKLAQLILRLSFSAILLGYLMVWLAQPVVGLSFLGLEMGEWVKFLPQSDANDFLPNRNLFYWPPITLSLMMIMWTVSWSQNRWKTWAMRCMAVLVALLAFPALDAIRDEPSDQWLFRLQLVILVVIIAVLVSQLDWLARDARDNLSWLTIFLLGLLGAIGPTWAFVAVRPVVAELTRTNVGIGPGVWLNIAGNLLAILVALYYLGDLQLFKRLQKSGT